MFSTRLTGLLALPALSAALIGAAVLGAAGTAHADDTPGGPYDPGAIQHTTTGPSSAERTTTTPPGVLGSIAGGGIFARTPGTPDLTAGGFVNPFAAQNDATERKRLAELNGAPGIIGVPVNGRLIAPNTPEWDKLHQPKPPTPPTLNDLAGQCKRYPCVIDQDGVHWPGKH